MATLVSTGQSRIPSRRGVANRIPPFLNLCGDYRFLRGGYWALVDAELEGVPSRPTPLQAVTAQNAASCLLVAREQGIATADWGYARDAHSLQAPCVLVPIGGFTDAWYLVKSAKSATKQFRSASQNGTRSVLWLDGDGVIGSFKLVVGMASVAAHAQLAWQVWSTFGLPLCRVWYLQKGSTALFLGLDPLPLHSLSKRDLRMLEEVSLRPMLPS